MSATVPRPPSICCVHGGASVVVVPRAGSGDEATAVLKVSTRHGPCISVRKYWIDLDPSIRTHLQVQVEGAADDKTVEAPTALPIGSVRGLALHGYGCMCE